MNNEIKLYIYIIRKKILKLYIKTIVLNYKNIISKDDTNFFNVYDLSFIDNNYMNIIKRLINVTKLINNITNNQLGGERKQNYSDKENEEIKQQLKKKIAELTKKIEKMQQQQIFLNNNNQTLLYKTEMYQNALVQRHAELTYSKAINQIISHKHEIQQNELNQCKTDRDILTNDNNNLREKILFFDKSLEILSKKIDTNLDDGMLYLKTYENKISEQKLNTTINIDLIDNPIADQDGKKLAINSRYLSKNPPPPPPPSPWGRSSEEDIQGGSDSDSVDDQSIYSSDIKSKQVNPLNFANLINTQNKKIT